jgi:hypothetical protein
MPLSFDHLVGSRQQRRRDSQPEHLGGLEVDDEFKPGWLPNWQIGRLLAFKDPSDVSAELASKQTSGLAHS